MANNGIKIAVGFIIYGQATAKYLPYFLPSLYSQKSRDGSLSAGNTGILVMAVDNSTERDNENTRHIESNYPDLEIDRIGENIGFARAYNRD